MNAACRACLLVALVTLLSVESAAALVGTIDRQNEFPYVTKLEIELKDGRRSSCSGVVHGFILSTAAHCLYSSEPGDGHGYARSVLVRYVDTLGVQRIASSKKMFVPQRYIDDDLTYHQNYRGAPHDIGYVVLDKDVVVPGYLHWGLELLRDDAAVCGYKPQCPNWWDVDTHSNSTFLENLKRTLGSDLTKVKVRVVGYGNNWCEDFNAREGHCESDGKRRFTELSLRPDLTEPGAPWVWCTGTNADGINPIQHGDSGGPVFVQALDGRWLYVGYTSRGDSKDGCASSMFNELNLWKQAMDSYESSVRRMSETDVYDDINAWNLTVGRQLIDEWLRIQSAPPEAALSGQSLLYLDPLEADNTRGKIAFYKQQLDFADIVAQRKDFFERWRVRNFSISDLTVKCESTDTFDFCWDRAIVRSHFEAKDGTVAEGQFQLSLRVRIPMFSTKALSWLSFLPVIEDEHCGPVAQTQPAPGFNCQVPNPRWTHNGSIVRLSAAGSKREFYYQVPRDGLAKVGVKPGTLLFSGIRSGDTYSGTAYIFNKRCGPIPYAVSGPVYGDTVVQLHGQVPHVDSNCQTVSTEVDWLQFVYEPDE